MTACVHHYVLHGSGPEADGTCRKCGLTRHFDSGTPPYGYEYLRLKSEAKALERAVLGLPVYSPNAAPGRRDVLG